MNPAIWALLATSLLTSTAITMASNHWLLAWLSLELNTLSILPIMMNHHHPRMTEATIKYFLIQATAAASIFFASTLNAWQTGHWSITHSNSMTTTTLITIALALKLGLAPTHLWYPEVLQGLPMYTALVVSTWQKLAPLSLLFLLHNNLNPTLIVLIGLLSTLTGGWTGLNQTQTRKLMAFSSIAHMGWLMIALSTSLSLAALSMMTYLITATAMFSALALTATKTMRDTGTTWTTSPTLTTTMMLTLLSLGGLPPLTGFMPKLLIIKELTASNLLLLSTLLLASTLPSLFFYTRMAYLTILTTPPTTTSMKLKWRLNTHHGTTTTTITTTATAAFMLLPLTTVLYNVT
uniref:NADH-ubiquinone oxidoreductase chain 2 n=2 Tax=Hemidactylus flaviviridis TaxID=260202 RepID=A0A077JG73_9SAUR|nr:NADH dehydrogenase subunit 2 [Hemidactylus flaviviridis]